MLWDFDLQTIPDKAWPGSFRLHRPGEAFEEFKSAYQPFALPLNMMVLMMRLFGLVDVPYIALNTFASAIGVATLYGLFYHKTAKTYYKMVKF